MQVKSKHNWTTSDSSSQQPTKQKTESSENSLNISYASILYTSIIKIQRWDAMAGSTWGVSHSTRADLYTNPYPAADHHKHLLSG